MHSSLFNLTVCLLANLCSNVIIYISDLRHNSEYSFSGLSNHNQIYQTPEIVGTLTGYCGNVIPKKGFPFYSIKNLQMNFGLVSWS